MGNKMLAQQGAIQGAMLGLWPPLQLHHIQITW